MTAITTRETIHGNPGERRVLPAGKRIRVFPADNLPDDSDIKWWVFPLSGDNSWSADIVAWAEDVGVGLTNEDVKLVEDE